MKEDGNRNEGFLELLAVQPYASPRNRECEFLYEYSHREYNPFPWPVGTTTVTSDGNGNIRAMENGGWRVEADFDFENRLLAIRWPGYPEVRFVYDAVGRKMKEIVIGGAETRFVNDGQDRIAQERDAENNKVEEYFWDGGRLLKRGTGANSSYVQSNISGTPLRFTDNTGEFTGGVLYSRMGEKVIAVNEDGWKIGFGGMRKTGPLPFLFGAYLAPLGKSLSRSFGGIADSLPQIPFPIAAYQGIFADATPWYMPSPVWNILQKNNNSILGSTPASVDGDPSTSGGWAAKPDCTYCCFSEGTLELSVLGPPCPTTRKMNCKQVTAPFHKSEGSCIKACITGDWVTYKETFGEAHCCNHVACCPVQVKCTWRVAEGCTFRGCVRGTTPKNATLTWDLDSMEECEFCYDPDPRTEECTQKSFYDCKDCCHEKRSEVEKEIENQCGGRTGLECWAWCLATCGNPITWWWGCGVCIQCFVGGCDRIAHVAGGLFLHTCLTLCWAQ